MSVPTSSSNIFYRLQASRSSETKMNKSDPAIRAKRVSRSPDGSEIYTRLNEVGEISHCFAIHLTLLDSGQRWDHQ